MTQDDENAVIGTPDWRAGVEWAIQLAKQHGARYQRSAGDPRPFAELLRDKADDVEADRHE